MARFTKDKVKKIAANVNLATDYWIPPGRAARPLEEQLRDKHPALKEKWEEYQVLLKLFKED